MPAPDAEFTQGICNTCGETVLTCPGWEGRTNICELKELEFINKKGFYNRGYLKHYCDKMLKDKPSVTQGVPEEQQAPIYSPPPELLDTDIPF